MDPDGAQRDLRRPGRRHRRRVRAERRRRGRRRRWRSPAGGSGGAARSTATGSPAARTATTAVPPVFFEAADVTIHDTWYSSGLRGTGRTTSASTVRSCRWSARCSRSVGQPTVDCAGRFPNFTLLAAGVAAGRLGIARHAIDEFTGDGRGQAAAVHVEDAGRDGVHPGRAGQGRGRAARRRGRSCTTRSAGRGTGAVAASASTSRRGSASGWPACIARARRRGRRRRVYTLAGGSACTSRARCSAACATPTCPPSTSMVSPKLYETLGRVLFGQEIDTTDLLDHPSVGGSECGPGVAAHSATRMVDGARASRVRRPDGVSSGGTTRPISATPAAA